jgi:hypothetical protein
MGIWSWLKLVIGSLKIMLSYALLVDLPCSRSMILTHSVSPKHKRTEGRSQLWDIEITTKAAALQRDSADFAARLNV